VSARGVFSVIVPTRGDAPFLRTALASALRNPEAAEIVVVHDRRPGRSDLRLPGHEGRVVTLEVPGVGPSATRNAGLARASHRRVAFLDDDDAWLPGHLARAGERLDGDAEATLVASDAFLLDDPTPDWSAPIPADPSALRRFRPDLPGPRLTLRDLLLGNPILTTTVAVDRERAGSELRFREELSAMEDYDLWLRLARRGKVAFDPVPGVVIRKRAHSTSADHRAMAECSLRIFTELDESGVIGDHLAAREFRRRIGLLWHDLAWATLRDGDAAACRAASLQALRRLPLRARVYAYLALSLLPASARRVLLRRVV
jgi:glycosyltransferase involved in cell wall biosynthesis